MKVPLKSFNAANFALLCYFFIKEKNRFVKDRYIQDKLMQSAITEKFNNITSYHVMLSYKRHVNVFNKSVL